MAGVIQRFAPRQILGRFVEQTLSRALRICLHEVEAADQNVRLEPFQEIQHALVGAAADQDTPAVFSDLQILLMPKILRQRPSLYAHCEAGRIDGEAAFPLVAGGELQPVIDLIVGISVNKPGIGGKLRS